MRRADLRSASIAILLCGTNYLGLTNMAALAHDSECCEAPSSVHARLNETPLPDLPLPSAAAPASSFDDGAVPFSTLIGLRRWLRNYGSPVVCEMIFCHSSCSAYDDGCPSFKQSLLANLLGQGSGCSAPAASMSGFAPASGIGSRTFLDRLNASSANGENCCAENTAQPETILFGGSPKN